MEIFKDAQGQHEMPESDCPTNNNLLEQIVGGENDGVVYTIGKETRVLIYTGPSISIIITEAFIDTLNPNSKA